MQRKETCRFYPSLSDLRWNVLVSASLQMQGSTPHWHLNWYTTMDIGHTILVNRKTNLVWYTKSKEIVEVIDNASNILVILFIYVVCCFSHILIWMFFNSVHWYFVMKLYIWKTDGHKYKFLCWWGQQLRKNTNDNLHRKDSDKIVYYAYDSKYICK